ncbi:MAG: ankyrin repeat domain-containing protein [Verrucomicrobiota bacterium]
MRWLAGLFLAGEVLAGSGELLKAVDQDGVEVVQELIAAGAEVNERSEYGVTPLGLACEKGRPGVVKVLLEAGAKFDWSAGDPVLLAAARGGFEETVGILLDAGAPVDQASGGQTALMWAAAGGYEDVVELLLTGGAEVERVAGESGLDALCFAVRAGRTGVVEQLVAAGADPCAPRTPKKVTAKAMRAGMAPLLLAIENGHFELAMRLVEMGADVNDLRSGFGPLHVLTWVRKPERGDGANGIAPPRIAGEMGSLDLVKALVARGAEVDLRLEKGEHKAGQVNPKGATDFLLGAKTCDLDYMKLLVELGADVTIPNGEGTSALLAAAGLGVSAPGEEAAREGEVIPVVKYLLEMGLAIDAVNDFGESVMHAAAYKGDPDLVFLLDERGADPEVWNRKNANGRTPLVIAHGDRPIGYRPYQYMIDAFGKVMRKHGLEVPKRPMGPKTPKKKGY